MTVEEFKAELERLVHSIDEPLAAALAKEQYGTQWACESLLPKDKSGRPEKGARIIASVSVYTAPVAYTYHSE